MPKKNIVIIGGGTGTATVISGLKKYNDLNITAIVAMSDSGGSTGRLRDEFGFPPVGDLRQSLRALARDDSQKWLKKLLLYRFSQGQDLKGHSLGNLILTALQDISGSTSKALEIAENIFKLDGQVYPSTDENTDLVIQFSDDSFIIGEDNLNPGGIGGKKIKKVYLSPKAKICPQAEQSIEQADLIIIGPGDLYASIIPNFLVTGAKKAFKNSKAQFIYILNLMNSFAQTHNYKASDYLKQIIKYSGRKPDHIIINNQKIPTKILKKYEQENEFPIENDLDQNEFNIIQKPLLSTITAKLEKGDALKRSLLRHDADKLAKIIVSLFSFS